MIGTRILFRGYSTLVLHPVTLLSHKGLIKLLKLSGNSRIRRSNMRLIQKKFSNIRMIRV